MKNKICINHNLKTSKYGPIYIDLPPDTNHPFNNYIEEKDIKEIELNHITDMTNPSVCLNIMMVTGDYDNEEKVNKFIQSLENFEYTFKYAFIVIDSIKKDEDANIDESAMNNFIKKLKEKKILSDDAMVRIDALQYKTKAIEYKELLIKIFNYESIDKIQVNKTYKNAFAYYYSLYHSPKQYMFHIDLPRAGRVEYVKSDNNEKDNNFILKCVHLLKEFDKSCFIGLLGWYEGRVNNNKYKNEFSAYFDAKIQISLQCWVCDTYRWKPTSDNTRYNRGFYRYQTENAISSSISGRGLTSLALHGCEVNVNKIGFRKNQ